MEKWFQTLLKISWVYYINVMKTSLTKAVIWPCYPFTQSFGKGVATPYSKKRDGGEVEKGKKIYNCERLTFLPTYYIYIISMFLLFWLSQKKVTLLQRAKGWRPLWVEQNHKYSKCMTLSGNFRLWFYNFVSALVDARIVLWNLLTLSPPLVRDSRSVTGWSPNAPP